MPTKVRFAGVNHTQLPQIVSDGIALKGLPQTAGYPDGYGDLASAVNEAIGSDERQETAFNVELGCNGYRGLSNSLFNSGGFYSVFPGSGITSAEFAAPYGWTFPTAAVNKRWFTSGPLTWDMSKKSVVLAFKIKAAAQASAQTYGGSMSGSSAGFSIVARASSDSVYPNNLEIRCRSGGGNFDSYFISTNLMDDAFHSVTVAFCAATKIMRVWVDGQYNGQAYMIRVMEFQSRGNLVGNERMVIGAAAASGTNSWIHSGKSLFYATYDGAISDLDMNQLAFNHHFNDTFEV
jgi:hypothetical protein